MSETLVVCLFTNKFSEWESFYVTLTALLQSSVGCVVLSKLCERKARTKPTVWLWPIFCLSCLFQDIEGGVQRQQLLTSLSLCVGGGWGGVLPFWIVCLKLKLQY